MPFTITLMRDCPGIRQVRRIQEELTKFTVKCVPTKALTENDLVTLNRLNKNLDTIFAEGFNLTLSESMKSGATRPERSDSAFRR